MELIYCIILFVFALLIIIFSGNYMVSSAVKISVITGIPQSIVGATIVSLATTLPELNVTIFSSMDGCSDIAVGNAIGSIVFNMTFVVGIILFFSYVSRQKTIIDSNFVIMVIALLVIFVFGVLDMINKWVGLLLFVIFIIFFVRNITGANRQNSNHIIVANTALKKGSLFAVVIIFCISSFFVSMGAKILVQNGERIARILDVSEHIIGVTIVAIGTSLPEMVTAISSIRQGTTNMALGNIIGANVLSSTMLIGISAMLEPARLVINSNILFVAIPIILLSSAILYIGTKYGKSKVAGSILLILFVLYYITVVL